jgi:hypothetical protein
MDNDAEVLKAASQAVMTIDLKYRASNFGDQRKLKPERDKAFNAFSAARLKLLADGVICTAEDVAEMKALRDEVKEAAKRQTLLAGILKVAAFLRKLV